MKFTIEIGLNLRNGMSSLGSLPILLYAGYKKVKNLCLKCFGAFKYNNYMTNMTAILIFFKIIYSHTILI